LKSANFLIPAIAFASLATLGNPAFANKYPDYQLIQKPSSMAFCGGGAGSTFSSGLTVYNCRSGKYKWCPNGKQFYTNNYGDEFCR